MKIKDLLQILDQKVTHKTDIYFAETKIDKYFKDQGFLVSEITKSAKTGEEFGLSIFKFISGKITGGNDISEKIILDSRDRGKIIERLSNIEIGSENTNGKNNPNELLHFLGPSHFTIWGDQLNIYEPEQNKLIFNEKKRQEKVIGNDTVLFTFKIKETIYASIADKENFDLGMLASYGPLESHGILGLIERKLNENIILINPFWIWYENLG